MRVRQPKDRLIVALDVPGIEEARRLVGALAGEVGMFKVGKELFTAEGPAVVREIVAGGGRVFLDLKFHDIPNTVERAVSVAAAGGPELLKAWCERLYRMIEEDRFVPLESAVDEASATGARARLRGARAPRDVLAAASELKAVTWHQLALAPDPSGGWRGRVIFDV